MARPALIVAMVSLALATGASVAVAQLTSPGIGPPSTQSPPRVLPAPAPRTSTTPVPLDRVIAVVNNEAVTQFDVNEQKRVVLSQMAEAKVQPPAADALEKQVL